MKQELIEEVNVYPGAQWPLLRRMLILSESIIYNKET
jgi:hypothetical protein